MGAPTSSIILRPSQLRQCSLRLVCKPGPGAHHILLHFVLYRHICHLRHFLHGAKNEPDFTLMPGTRAWEEESVGVLAKPAVAPGRDAMEGAEESSFGGWALEVNKIVGGAVSGGEGSVIGGGHEAEESSFVVGVANKDGLGEGRWLTEYTNVIWARHGKYKVQGEVVG